MKPSDVRDSIARTKEFMQLWVKFHQLYVEAMNKTSITPEEEEAFLETKSIIARKFQALADSLSIDRSITDRTYDVINQILSLDSISTLSEPTLKKLENDWHESYISLNRIHGHLEAQASDPTARDEAKASLFKGISKVILFIVGLAVLAVVALFIAYLLGFLPTLVE